jgi:hypothetical protein
VAGVFLRMIFRRYHPLRPEGLASSFELRSGRAGHLGRGAALRIPDTNATARLAGVSLWPLVVRSRLSDFTENGDVESAVCLSESNVKWRMELAEVFFLAVLVSFSVRSSCCHVIR